MTDRDSWRQIRDDVAAMSLRSTREPSEMGVWSDFGEVWLPKSLYPRRWDAVKFAIDQWQVHFLDVRCLSRWMVYDPSEAPKEGLSEDWWSECARDWPGAFPVWRLEQA